MNDTGLIAFLLIKFSHSCLNHFPALPDLTGLIQVAWDLRDEITRRREERALLCAMEELDVDMRVILTEDYEENLENDGKTINTSRFGSGC